MAPGARGLCLGPSWSGCPSHGNEKWEMTGFSVLKCLGWGVHVPRAAAQTLVMGGGVCAGWPSTKGRPSLEVGEKLLMISVWPRCRGEFCLQMEPPLDMSGSGSDPPRLGCLGWAALCTAPTCGHPVTVFLGSTAQPGVQHSVGPTLPSPTLSAACTPQQPGASVPWAPALAQGPLASHTASARVAPQVHPPQGCPEPRSTGGALIQLSQLDSGSCSHQ